MYNIRQIIISSSAIYSSKIWFFEKI